MSARRLKVAVIGFGKMGMLHAGVLSSLPGVQLTAICEKNGFIRRFLKKIFRDTIIVDGVKNLSNIGLDAVYVTTPIRSHFPVIESVYENGVAGNLFVEKTLASSLDEARRICDWARRFGGVNMVGYVRRFSVTFMRAKSLLDSNIIGAPASFEAYAYSSDFFGLEKDSRVNAPQVDVVRDLGCYALDLALWFFGDLKVKNVRFKSVACNGSIDSVRFSVKTLDNIVGNFSVSWCVNGYRMPEVGFLIKGSEGNLYMNDDELTLSLKDREARRMLRHDLGDECGFWLGGPEYYREDEHFIRSVAQGKPAEPCFEAAAKVDCLIDEVLAKADQVE
ncbi:MAG: Gfo/Idh/MocA family oxidoreductase [Candidatus Bathyarchaeia archaeon]